MRVTINCQLVCACSRDRYRNTHTEFCNIFPVTAAWADSVNTTIGDSRTESYTVSINLDRLLHFPYIITIIIIKTKKRFQTFVSSVSVRP